MKMSQTREKVFLGSGWAFPIHPESEGDMAMSVHEEDVRQSIKIILATKPGERVMRPSFGSGLHALVFEPMNTTTMTLVKTQVEDALIAWEPRIDNINIDVSADPPNGRLLVGIQYRLRQSNTFYNLVYPFYLLEAKES